MIVSLPLVSASGSDAAATARTEIWRDMNKGAIGSAAIAIMDNGKIVYSEGFGMADRELSIPVTKTTIFNIGSVSKVYAAAAIMLLVDEGKVDLDKPVTTYLPEFSMADKRFRDITVRMTLNHTSGIPGTTGANNFGYKFNQDVYQDTLANLAQSNLKHRPGEMAIYCNDGFTLAEMIVAKVSGQSFMEFLTTRIFTPLGLNNTGASVGQRLEKGVTPAMYFPPNAVVSEPLEVLSVLGAGGLSSSAEDLCRFVDLFSGENDPILTGKALAELTKEQPSEFHGKLRSPDVSLGLGWDVTDHEPYKSMGVKVLGKSGGTGTYTAQVFTAPEHRITVALLSTGKNGNAGVIADKVLAAYLADKGLMAKTAKALTVPVTAQPIPVELKVFEGYYSNGANITRLAVDLEQGTLTGYKVEGKTESPVLSAVYNSGYFHSGEKKLYFEAVGDKQYLIQHIAAFKADMIANEKIEPVSDPPQLAVNMDGQKWLRRNVQAFEGRMAAAGHVITSSIVKALPGYLDFGDITKIESPTFAAMPVKSFRDLSELRLIEKQGQMWAWTSGMIFMPADLAATLISGQTSHVITTTAYNEWLKVTENSALSFAKPAHGRVIVFAPDNAVLYDSAVDQGEVFAPAGSFVELAGHVGDSFQITATVIAE